MKNLLYPSKCERSGKYPTCIAVRSVFVWLILIVSTALLASPTLPPQHETLFTLSFVDAPLKDVFAEIEKDSEFTFVYKDVVNIFEKVTFTADKERIETILPQLLKGQDLSFEIDDKQITIYKKESKPFRETSPTIKGIVIDSYGEPIVCASVQVKGSSEGTVSGTKGEFELPVSRTVTLIVSFADARKMEVVAYPGQNMKIVLQ